MLNSTVSIQNTACIFTASAFGSLAVGLPSRNAMFSAPPPNSGVAGSVEMTMTVVDGQSATRCGCAGACGVVQQMLGCCSRWVSVCGQVVAALTLLGISRFASAWLGWAAQYSSLLMHDSCFRRDGDLGSARGWSGWCRVHGACRGVAQLRPEDAMVEAMLRGWRGAAGGARAERWLHGRGRGSWWCGGSWSSPTGIRGRGRRRTWMSGRCTCPRRGIWRSRRCAGLRVRCGCSPSS